MTLKGYNEKTIDIFKRMKPLFEEYLELENENTEHFEILEETKVILDDCVTPFLNAVHLQNSYGDEKK